MPLLEKVQHRTPVPVVYTHKRRDSPQTETQNTNLVGILDGRLSVAGRIADNDGCVDFSWSWPSPADNLDRNLIIDQLARYIADANFSFDIFLLQAEIAAFNRHQSATFNRPTQRLDLKQRSDSNFN